MKSYYGATHMLDNCHELVLAVLATEHFVAACLTRREGATRPPRRRTCAVSSPNVCL